MIYTQRGTLQPTSTGFPRLILDSWNAQDVFGGGGQPCSSHNYTLPGSVSGRHDVTNTKMPEVNGMHVYRRTTTACIIIAPAGKSTCTTFSSSCGLM